MIDSVTIARIKDAARIEEVVADCNISLRKAGANLTGCCPFHQEKTASFVVSPAKGIFKCFGCGEGGDAITFVMKMHDMTYVEALRSLAQKYHIEIQERELTPEQQAAQKERETLLTVLSFCQSYFEESLQIERETNQSLQKFLTQNRLLYPSLQKYRIGFAPEHKSGLTKRFLELGYKAHHFAQIGACTTIDKDEPTDTFQGVITLPYFSRAGKTLGFGAISFESAALTYSTQTSLFLPDQELFGMLQNGSAISRLKSCYIVPHPIDVVALYQIGIENCVAATSVQLSERQVAALERLTTQFIFVLSERSAKTIALNNHFIPLLKSGIHIKLVLLPSEKPLYQELLQHNAIDFIDYLQQKTTDYIRYKTDLHGQLMIQHTERQNEILTNLLRVIAIIPNEIVRNVYIQECSKKLYISEHLLMSFMEEERRKYDR